MVWRSQQKAGESVSTWTAHGGLTTGIAIVRVTASNVA
jgi:hypothetical protein